MGKFFGKLLLLPFKILWWLVKAICRLLIGTLRGVLKDIMNIRITWN